MADAVLLRRGLLVGTSVYAEVGAMGPLTVEALTAALPERYAPITVQRIEGELVAWKGHWAVVRLAVPVPGIEMEIACW